MKFIRVDEDTVRCIVTEEDMKEHGVEIDDFLSNKGNVHEFLHSIVEQAVEEVGYEAKNGVLSMQVVPLPKNTLAITFSEKEDQGIQDMISQIKDVVGDVGDIINKDMLTAMGDQLMRAEQNEEDMISDSEVLPADEDVKLEEKEEKKQTRAPRKPQTAIFKFQSFDELEALGKAIPIDKPINSKVYKNDKTGEFHLIIEKARLSVKNFSEVCKLTNEFGVFEGKSIIRAAHIMEHERVIIKKKAIEVLKNL